MGTNETSGTPPSTASNIGALAAMIIGTIFVYQVLYRGEDPNQYKKEIQEKLIADGITQYEHDKENGSYMDRCVQAGIIANLYEDNLDTENHKKWKAIEETDCQKAGVTLDPP